MKHPSLLRLTILMSFILAWITLFLFAWAFGDETLIATMFSLNILLLFIFIVATLVTDQDHKSVIGRLETLIRILFKNHTGTEDACLFGFGNLNAGFSSDKSRIGRFQGPQDHLDNHAVRVELHSADSDSEWMHRSKQIEQTRDRLRIRMDAKGRIVKVTDDVATYHNTTKRKLMRFTKDDIHERLHLDNPKWFHQAMRSSQSHATGEIEFKGEKVKIFWLFKAHYDHEERLYGIEGYGRRITDFIDRSQTENSENLDDVTGLMNVSSLYERLKSEESPEKAIAFFLNVDGFSKINDYYGYAFGNKALKKLAESLRGFESEHTILARVSADQFTLVCLEADKNKCETLKASMESLTQISLNVDGVDLLLNIKIGYARYPDHAATLEELVAKANLAVKQYTSSIPYAFISYDHSIGDALKKQVHLSQRLKKAIREDAIDIHFQKILDVRTGSVTSVEALARWTDSVYGRVEPVEMFEVAEVTGMTIMLEKVLVDKALKLFKTLKKDTDYEDARLALNLAPASLLDGDFLHHLEVLMQKRAIAHSDITIEVSEKIFMNNLESCLERIRTYKSRGFKIAIDDFGKDFSSLSILERIDFDVIKIDAMFVKNIAIKKNQEIFRMVRRITENTRQTFVVEGVETKDQKHILEALGCFFQQGYLHHYPRPLK